MLHRLLIPEKNPHTHTKKKNKPKNQRCFSHKTVYNLRKIQGMHIGFGFVDLVGFLFLYQVQNPFSQGHSVSEWCYQENVMYKWHLVS